MDALSKAGLLDRVMEVVDEVDEDETPSVEPSRRLSLVPRPEQPCPEEELHHTQQPALLVTSATLPDLKSASPITNGSGPEERVVRKYRSLQEMQSNGYSYSDAHGPDPYLQALIDGQGSDLKEAIAQAQTPPVEMGQKTATAFKPYGGMSVQDIISLSRGEPASSPVTSAFSTSQTQSGLPSHMQYVQTNETLPDSPHSTALEAVQSAKSPAPIPARSPRPRFTDGLPHAERPLSGMAGERDAFYTPEDELEKNPLDRADPLEGKEIGGLGNQPLGDQADQAETGERDVRRLEVPVTNQRPIFSPTPVVPVSTLSSREIVVLISAGTLPMPTSFLPVRLESFSMVALTSYSTLSRSVEGTLLVLASHLSNSVFIRLTRDGWTTVEEVQSGRAEAESTDAEYGRHVFEWQLSPNGQETEVHLAVRLEEGNGRMYWDNNDGRNYTVKIPLQTEVSAPISHLLPAPSILPPIPPHSPLRETPPISRQSSIASGRGEENVIAPDQQTESAFEEQSRESLQQGPATAPTSNFSTHSQSNGLDTPPLRLTIPQIMQMQQNTYTGPSVSSIPLPPPNGYGHMHNRRTLSASGSTHSSSSFGTPLNEINSDVPVDMQHSSYAQPAGTPIPDKIPRNGPSVPGDKRDRESPNSRNITPTQALQQSLSSSHGHSTPMYPVQRSATETGTPDMPTFQTALDQQPDPLNDVSRSPVQMNGHNSAPHSSGVDEGVIVIAGLTTEETTPGTRSTNELQMPASNGTSGVGSNGTLLQSEKSTLAPQSPNRSSTGTMRSLIVTNNAAQTLNRSFFRNNANSTLRQDPNRTQMSGKAPGTIIALSNTAFVPSKLGSDECLVQVYASAVDFWDRAKVDILSSRGQGHGFIPGRAFVGKVRETGSKIDPGKIKVGDMVYGLNELKKVNFLFIKLIR